MSKFACPGPAKTEEDATKKSYQFWSTQPVPAIDEVVTTNEFISDDVPTSEVRQEPYSLPDGFKWDTLQLDDPLVLKEVYVLVSHVLCALPFPPVIVVTKLLF